MGSLIQKTMIYLLVCYGFMLVSGNYIKSSPKAIAHFKDGNHTYIIQMSDQPHNDTSCATYQLISFIPHLMSEVNTLFTDCVEEADPDGHVTVDISQAVFTPGADEMKEM